MSVIIRTSGSISEATRECAEKIRFQMERRTFLAANELRNASQLILRGSRGGRSYKIPGTKKSYQASAPGEPPAVRTGTFRASWQPSAVIEGNSYVSKIESSATTNNGKYNLGELLENGTAKMAARPHQEKILEKAEPAITRIYNEPYF